MLRAVLFDLDGTLLDIDLDEFLGDYFEAIGPVVASLMGQSDHPGAAIRAVLAGTAAMGDPHRGTTNQQEFDRVFEAAAGISLAEPTNAEHIERFYREQFPALRKTHLPMGGGRDAYEAARAAGLSVVVATNPIFPRAAIVERIRWAGFSVDEFDLVTDYETMEATKPDPHYYRSIARMLGVLPEECLMVGDDAGLDMAAADVGMKTYFAGPPSHVSTDWSGDLAELALLLPRLVA